MADAMLFVNKTAHIRQKFFGVPRVPRFQDNVSGKGVVVIRYAPGVNVVNQRDAWNVLNVGAKLVKVYMLRCTFQQSMENLENQPPRTGGGKRRDADGYYRVNNCPAVDQHQNGGNHHANRCQQVGKKMAQSVARSLAAAASPPENQRGEDVDPQPY